MITSLRWLLNGNAHSTESSKARSSKPSPSRSNHLRHLPDFSQTGYFLLTDVYLQNHWFISLCMNFVYSDLIMALGAKSYLLTTLVMQVPYVWFRPRERKPPDKFSTLFPEGVPSSTAVQKSCFDTTVEFFKSFGDEVAKNIASREQQPVPEPSPQDEHLKFEWTRMNRKMREPRIVRCNAILNTNARFNNAGSQFDLQSEFFVIDTGSTDHLCCNKSLFVGDIAPLRGVKLQGVGGLLEASGFGTIRFNLFDDNGASHTFTIHNVLYVPEAPMNLLSPQKWIAGLPSEEKLARGAMSITLNDISLLIWN